MEKGNCSNREMALDGLKVLDFTLQIAGPSMTSCMADYGAEVIKIESELRPDGFRIHPPYKGEKPHINRSFCFCAYNGGKRSISINLGTTEGRRVVRELVAWADVVTENFAPGVMKKWGLSYEDMQKVNPDVIMLSSSGYGQTGPRRAVGAFAAFLTAATGFVHLAGWPDRPGVFSSGAYTDIIAPWYGLIALMSSLDYRRRTGKGQYIDLSQFEGGVSFLMPALLEYECNDFDMGRVGNRDPRSVPHNVYPCKGHGRWCAIAVFTDEEWSAFCRAIGSPRWCSDPRFGLFPGRKENEDELDALVSSWTSRCSAEEVEALLQGSGVAAGVVENAADMVNDRQLAHRRFFQWKQHPEMGESLHFGWPMELSRTPAITKRAPLLGEDTEKICSEILRTSDEEFVRLLDSGALR